ncbi:uncharacterized protein LOC134224997 isoform X2 [Armigeres subalbatus]|uniref:uncharacterized protein LOC134224997 isoform X2 n=1 Tax=Armigeres subalbatus TaxID=124917 RepID=UPI002ED03DFA
MLMHLHPQMIAIATSLLVLSLMISLSRARVSNSGPEKPFSVAHNEDETSLHNYHYPNIMENDEENEVISVRLLNSHLKPISADNKHDSYEHVPEFSAEKVVSKTDIKNTLSNTIETTTVSFQMLTTMPQKPEDYSLEKDWIQSRIEIPISSEEMEIATTTTIPKPQTSSITTHIPPFTTSVLPPTTPKAPLVFGNRRRKARNYNYYDELPEVDLDHIDPDELEESAMNGKRLKDLIAQGFKRNNVEDSSRSKNRRAKTRPTSTTTTICPCAKRRKHPPPTNDYYAFDDDNDYNDHSESIPQRPPVKKRLINQQNRLPSDDDDEDYLDDLNASLERAERVQGALERIMGIVTIMSHVDSFIHKKTKQSIRRLAKLYESVEE